MQKALIVVVVLFVGFYLLTEPVALADLAQNGGAKVVELVGAFFEAVIAFLNALVS